ncbi:hypothetical protein ABH926_007532 [Catenulispora sp. GP43]
MLPISGSMRTLRLLLAVGLSLAPTLAATTPASAGGGAGMTLTATMDGQDQRLLVGTKHTVHIALADTPGEADLRDITISLKDLDPRPLPVTCRAGQNGHLSLEPDESVQCTAVVTAAVGFRTLIVRTTATVPSEGTLLRTVPLHYDGFMPPPPPPPRLPVFHAPLAPKPASGRPPHPPTFVPPPPLHPADPVDPPDPASGDPGKAPIAHGCLGDPGSEGNCCGAGKGGRDCCPGKAGSASDCCGPHAPGCCSAGAGSASDCCGPHAPGCCSAGAGSANGCCGPHAPGCCPAGAGSASDCCGPHAPGCCPAGAGSANGCCGPHAPECCSAGAGSANGCCGPHAPECCSAGAGSASDCCGPHAPGCCSGSGAGSTACCGPHSAGCCSGHSATGNSHCCGSTGKSGDCVKHGGLAFTGMSTPLLAGAASGGLVLVAGGLVLVRRFARR